MASPSPPSQVAGARRRWIRWTGLILGVIGLGVAVATTADDFDGSVNPGVVPSSIGAILAIVSLTSAGRSWSTLLRAGSDGRDVRGALYLSQLSKYLPAGGLIQAAGQVSMTVRGSVSASRAAVAFPIAALEIVVAGIVIGSGLALQSEVPTAARLLAAFAPVSVVVLHPAVLRTVLRLGRRVFSRVPEVDHLPEGRDILRSTFFATLNMAATSAAYVVLLSGIAPGVEWLPTFHAFSAAWVIGFLVVPIPSGLGIRESVLVALVPGLDVAVVLAASLAHRVVTVLAEALVTGANAASRRRRPRDDQKSPA